MLLPDCFDFGISSSPIRSAACLVELFALSIAVFQYLSLGFEQRHLADPHYSNVDLNRNVMPNS
jgi:hypothetical protein